MGSQRVVYGSAARTATPVPVVFPLGQMDDEQNISLVVDLTAFTTAASLTVTVEVYDRAIAKWVTVLTSAAITTVSTTRHGPTAAGELTRVTVTHGNANSTTYSVAAHLSR